MRIGEKLRATRYDKNSEYVQGAAAAPARVRFQPWLGHVTKRECRSQLLGRWTDEVTKNSGDERNTKLRWQDVWIWRVTLSAEIPDSFSSGRDPRSATSRAPMVSARGPQLATSTGGVRG